MPSIKIDEDDLRYYQGLERALYTLQYFLVDCRCSNFCNHKFALRGTVNEIAEKIDAHKAVTYLQVMKKEADQRANAHWSSDFGKGPVQSDWQKSSGGFQLPGPETP